jgi:hypothetical protein
MAASAISDKAVATIVKRAVVAAEISAGATVAEATATSARFAGHSLRAGSQRQQPPTTHRAMRSSDNCGTSGLTPLRATFVAENCSRRTRPEWPVFEG